MSAASVVRSELSDAAARLKWGKRLASAGLTATERTVLGLRLRGMSYRQVAAAIRRSAARVEQLERQAIRKLTRVADQRRRVSVASVLQSGRLVEGRPPAGNLRGRRQAVR